MGGEKEGLNEKRRDLRDVDVVSTVWRRRREILRVGNTFHSAKTRFLKGYVVHPSEKFRLRRCS